VRALGYHLLIEFNGCDHGILNDVGRIKSLLDEAALVSGASIVDSIFHRFNPHGVSGVVVIAESHLAIHTWPEYGYAAVDLFTCGETVDPWKAYEFLKKGLKPQSTSTKEILRGESTVVGSGADYGPTAVRVGRTAGKHL